MKIDWHNLCTWTRDIAGSVTLAAGTALQAGILPPNSKPYLIATAIVTVAGILGKQATNPSTFPQAPLVSSQPGGAKSSLENK